MGDHSSIIVTLAGISVFMYGMTLASSNLQKLAANRIRDLLKTLGNKPLWGVLVGILLTVLIQSSGAVTSMLVGLASAGVVTLAQVMGVILGTAIGTTVTVQLLSLKVTEYGVAMFTFAFMVFFVSNKRTVRRTMKIVMGFGMIFWGLELIGMGTESLRNAEFFVEALDLLKAQPLFAIAATAAFTAIVHSSAATVGFAMSLAATGSISLVDAMYWVYGANIGTTATALLASAGGNYVARQVAWAHCLFKVAGVVIFYYFTTQFAELVPGWNIQRNIANSHTIFNIVASLLFLPFIRYGVIVIEKMFPPSREDKEFSVKFLDRSNFQSSSVVVAHARREAMRMADIFISMLKDSVVLFKDENKDLFLDIRERDNKVDHLNREISLFLTEYMDDIDGPANREMIGVVSFATDIESAADVIDNSMADMAKKKHNLKLEFSEDGWREIEELHEKTLELCTMACSAYQLQDKELGSRVIFQKRELRKLEKKLRESHIERLVAGRSDSRNTSSIHLDVLTDLRRISGLMTNHVYGMMKSQDKYNILHRPES